MPIDPLVTTEWLSGELDAADLRIIDATIFLPGNPRDARKEFEAEHIPGAIFLDLKNLVDDDHAVPNMLPPAEKFSSQMRALGIGDGSRIVIYDNSDLHSSARAWWMFKIFGANNVAILDGGMQKWIAQGRPTEAGINQRQSRHFTPWEDKNTLRSKEDILRNLESNAEIVVDARGADRFNGSQEEPRPNMAAGHIPGACNLPYANLFNADGTFKQTAELENQFAKAKIDFDRPMVATCGSGITAAVLFFAARLCGKQDVAIYDGSWSEWGADPETPKATGGA